MSCSGRFTVLGIDTDGGTDGDFTKKNGRRVAARQCPYGLFPAMAGADSNLTCEVDDELRPLRQIPAPKVMILKGLRNAGKPGRGPTSADAGPGAPVEYSSHVFSRAEISPKCGFMEVEEWVLTGFSRQREQVCS